jgi:ABC-type branched-subunit amino acid transport system substrate-binding protein
VELRRLSLVVATAVVTAGLAACSNQTPSSTGASGSVASNAPGVSRHSIIVGSLATASGPLAGQFGETVYGVQAYLDAVDATGGVDGRKIYLKYQADDGGNPTDDTIQARNLVEQDHVFAVLGVGTPFFTGATFLASEGTPAFGYLVSQNWNVHKNLFGAYGSFLNYSEVEPGLVDIAKELRATSVAVVAYGIAAQSADACGAVVTGLKMAGIHVGFENLDFGLGANPTADVLSMKAAHTDFFISCMEGSDNLVFDETMRQYGMTGVHSLWLQGYDRAYLKQAPADMVGVIYLEQHVPFEAATQFPGRYPAMEQYLRTMKKYEPQWTYDDLAFEGYLNAVQFVQGLKEEAATGKPLTQANLIAAINKEKAFTGGLTTPVNWSKAHTTSGSILCGSLIEVERGDVLRVVYAKNGEVFACTNLRGTLVPPPAGTPGL